MTNRKLHVRFRLAPRSMTLNDLELANRWPPYFKYLNQHNSGCIIQDRDVMFGSNEGFLGTVDLMVQLSFSKKPRWRLTAILDITKMAITSQQVCRST